MVSSSGIIYIAVGRHILLKVPNTRTDEDQQDVRRATRKALKCTESEDIGMKSEVTSGIDILELGTLMRSIQKNFTDWNLRLPKTICIMFDVLMFDI